VLSGRQEKWTKSMSQVPAPDRSMETLKIVSHPTDNFGMVLGRGHSITPPTAGGVVSSTSSWTKSGPRRSRPRPAMMNRVK
jgi:hypothetical protein